jgi:Fe-S-cluster containining protein
MKKRHENKKNSLTKCIECGNSCCRYITVKIPAPRSIHDFDGLFWELSHINVKAFKDSVGWYLLIYNPCVHLKNNGKCAIYENRPITCREHSNKDCEHDTPIKESAILFFDDHRSLEKYCKKRFKTWNRRF